MASLFFISRSFFSSLFLDECFGVRAWYINGYAEGRGTKCIKILALGGRTTQKRWTDMGSKNIVRTKVADVDKMDRLPLQPAGQFYARTY